MARLLIVSNRLPITVRLDDGKPRLERSSGGLATGLQGPHEQSGGLWIGWTGLSEALPEPEQAELDRRLADLRLAAVPLSQEEVQQYYQDYCNGIIWPLFHYFVGELPLRVFHFEVYERVNQRFADAVVKHYRPGDTIWVHDYQLMLVPQMVRERLPDARIGFFLHIPFPSSEVFRTLPSREQILEGMLGADLVGFHTAAYMRHFSSAVLGRLGVETEVDLVRWQHRRVRLGVFPMGIDAQGYASQARRPEVLDRMAEFRPSDHIQTLVGIDRLDYTKGIPRRLLAFEHLLHNYPELRGHVRLIQAAVPSRTDVEAYQEFRDGVDAIIGHILGAFATPSWVPIHYLYRGLSEQDVVALYRMADVMLVTPIRDGMNLVAKEFVASRVDENGVLVLSEFAGAASELAEALLVNPYDVEQTAEAYHAALTMPADERRTCMKTLRHRVFSYDVHRWARSFLARLERVEELPEPTPAGNSPPEVIQEALARLRAAEHLLVLLDYDGTLVGFTGLPELAKPDTELLALLRELASRPRTEVHVISGRKRETLAQWLGALPLSLHAEHGLWYRWAGETEWNSLALPPATWRDPVRAILDDFAARTPGSLVEEKTVGLAWHYRMAEPVYGAVQANELKLHLTALLSNAPVEILPGNKVIEVRPYGINKGRLVPEILARAPADARVLAMGDDRTDEDLFSALPEDAISIRVGSAPSRAQLRVSGVKDARAFLHALVKGP